jgi:GNAT superfamily N-acetyltransferase
MTMNASSPFALRTATPADIPALRDLHARSWVDLGGASYTKAQIAGLMTDIVTVAPDLITGGTYYVIEHSGRLVASGGWTMREQVAFYDQRSRSREPGPYRPSATIRAVFTAPDFARRGLARQIMNHAERQAIAEGKACEIRLTATLSGLPFYSSIGYRAGRTFTIDLSNGEAATAVEMCKDTRGSGGTRRWSTATQSILMAVASASRGSARRKGGRPAPETACRRLAA